MKKIGLFGCCQLHLTYNFFFNQQVLNQNNIQILFALPFYIYDDKYPQEFTPILDYKIFDDLDILILENNNLENQASSKKIIDYCNLHP